MLKTSLIFAALLLGAGSAHAQAGRRTSPHGQVVDLALDLGPTAEAMGVKPADLGAAFTAVFGDGAAWTGGVTGAVPRDQFFLELKEGRGQPRSLHVKLGLSPGVAVLEECAGTDGTACVAADTAWKGAVATVKAPSGATWTLELGAHPCGAGIVCDFYLPSWALANRLDNPGQGDAPFPRLVTVAEIKGRALCFFNAETGARYLCLDHGANRRLAGLGGLVGVQAYDAGVLALAFEDGTLVLDFAKDRAWLAGEDGIEAATAPLAWLAQADFVKTFTRPAKAALLGVTPELALWADGFVDGWRADTVRAEAWRANPGTLTAAAIVPGAPTLVRGLMQVEGQPRIYEHGGADGWLELARLAPDALRDAAGVQLIGKSVLASVPELGLVRIDPSGRVATSLGGGAQTAVFADGSAVAVRGEGAACRRVHFAQSTSEAASFAESGLAFGCGGDAGYVVGAGSFSATVRTGVKVTAAVVRK